MGLFTMGYRGQRRKNALQWMITHLAFLLCFLKTYAQIRYSIPEELKQGSIVGNIAQNLGLDVNALVERRFRIVSGSKEQLLQVNQNNGDLYVNKIIDREELCERNSVCVINLKTVVENPLEIHYVAIEILDINDNSPSFPENEKRLEIAELTLPGARFQLDSAHDPDIGVNSIRLYKLHQDNHFELEVRDRGEDNKIPFLVLKKALDRELSTEHKLVLTAIDGGNPQKSGSLNITIVVLDVNDNRPIFNQDIYTVALFENVPFGTVVTKVNATDLDEGPNGEVVYSFGNNIKSKVYELFNLDANTGEITVKGGIDFEERDVYEINVQASDKGQVPMTVDCSVVVKIKDVNDNAPDIEITSLSGVIAEDASVGTVIALISVTDLDSGDNGQVFCTVSESVPFQLKSSFQDNLFSLVTKSRLDRETTSQYNITLIAQDRGQPSLSSEKTIHVSISDVNDNRPVFSQSSYTLYLTENNPPGMAVFSVSASDPDQNENAVVSYYIFKGEGKENSESSYLSINSENGNIYALKSFDFENIKNFQFQVVAKDSGVPSLSSNVTVEVYILDQNDNAPVILSPLSRNGSAEAVEQVPRNVNSGYLVTKVRAYDADIGYNAWLSFSLQQVTDFSLFGLDRFTGQIKTLRLFTETDETEHKLIIVVKDNGNVSLSTTATILITTVEKTETIAVSDIKTSATSQEGNNVTFYLIITLGSVSFLFVISIITLIAMQCCRPQDYLNKKYTRDPNYAEVSGNGTLCHSIQYRAGEKRYMLVGPRMSIGSTIGLGSNGNSLIAPERGAHAPGEVS
ncbi:protocadherin alpha-6-like [Amia ocellicauda]|uniref:protocadherin alpha-6-like n=1 Tax=Amia ocellicauda TaxID=2972642 RepID=UPI003464758C